MRSTTMRTDQLRDAVAKTARMLAKDQIRVTQIGAQAFCEFDPKNGKVKRINLPVIPDNPTDEFLLALQGFLDHELGHAFHTNGMERCTPTEVDEDGTERKVNLQGLTNIVEDVRIEAEMAKMFRGSEANLEGLRDFMIESYWGKWLGQVQAAALAPEEKERRLRTLSFVPFMRARGGQKKCWKWMDANRLFDVHAELDKRIPDLGERLQALESTEDSLRLARLINAALTPPPPPPKPEKPPEEPPEHAPTPVPSDEKDPDKKPDEIDYGQDGEMGDLEGDRGEEQPPEQDEGSGAGGSKDESDSETHKADADAPEDDTPEDHETNGATEDEGEEPGQDEHADKKDEKPGKGQSSSRMREAMMKLSPEQRRALFLYNKRRQTVEQIAGPLGKSVSEAGSILGEARRKLRKNLRSQDATV